MATTVLRRVPVLMTGTWNASTGTEPITDDTLRSIVDAYNSGYLDPGVLKIGHIDPRFNNHVHDGEPAYGQIKNPVIDDGVLYVDYDPIDEELASRLEVAYPRCSVELANGVTISDADGNDVASFPTVLTAVALLGSTPPAVMGLSTRYSARTPPPATTRPTIAMSQFPAVARYSFPGGNTANSLSEKLRAAVSARYDTITGWAYVEDFDDTTVIFTVETDQGYATYKTTYTVTSNGAVDLADTIVPVVREVSWVSEPTSDTPSIPPVREETLHAMSAKKNAAPEPTAPAEDPDPAATTDPEPAEAPEPTTDPEPTPDPAPQNGDNPMSVDKDTAANLRRQYNLPDNASYEDILAAMLDAGTTPVPANTKPGTDEDDNKERAKAQAEEAVQHQEATARPLMSHGKPAEDDAEASEDDAATVTNTQVSASALAAWRAEHEAMKAELAEARAEKDRERRDGLVSSWFSTGRIGRDEVDTVRRSLDRHEDTTRELIEARTPMFSAEETGHNLNTPDLFAADTAKTIAAKQYEADDAVFGTIK